MKIEVQKNFKSLSGFSFCPSRGCEVVYFRGEETIEKNGLRVKVGLKESSAKSRWLCYCFGYTLERIQNEIQKTGKTTVLEEITAKIKAKECSCKTKNPQGRCCLGEIKKALQEISYEF
ncbi:MAG: hypothetical protein D6805_08690 [Planctomycetota bacterium]|nr:MAG: hypothetical protein D6805_08690 [Planctomycetota bacterium]